MRGTWIVAVLWTWTWAGAAAAIQEDLTPAQLEERAERVVVAEVTSTEARWAGHRDGEIETVVWLAVEQTLKGTPAATLALITEGGELGDHGTWVPDEPRLLPDHRYRLALVLDGHGRWRVIGGAAGAVPLGPLPCYDLSGVDWAYQANPIEEDFSLNVLSFPDPFVSDELVEEATTLSMEIWNSQGAALVVMPYGGHTTDTQYGGGNNDVNAIMYSAQTWGSTLAKTVYNYTGGTDIVDCDMQFYGANNGGTIPWTFDIENGAPPNTYDFVHTAVHELGHCLGLSHSSYEAAIMYAYSTPGSGWEKRNLHFDDIDGLQAIYGEATVVLALLDGTLAEVGGDAIPEPGDTFGLAVPVENQGTGTSYDIVGSASASSPWISWSVGESGIGDLCAGAAAGTEQDALEFEFVIDPGCDEDAEVTFTVTVEDAAGNGTARDWQMGLICEDPHGDDDDPGDDDDDDGGNGLVASQDCSCGVAGGTPAGSALLAALVPLLALRRRAATAVPRSDRAPGKV